MKRLSLRSSAWGPRHEPDAQLELVLHALEVQGQEFLRPLGAASDWSRNHREAFSPFFISCWAPLYL
jgi:hypothetical protein